LLFAGLPDHWFELRRCPRFFAVPSQFTLYPEILSSIPGFLILLILLISLLPIQSSG
jgi:hypothetical protein